MRNVILIFMLINLAVFSLYAQIPEAKVTTVNGFPQLFLNAKKIPPVMTFVNIAILCGIADLPFTNLVTF